MKLRPLILLVIVLVGLEAWAWRRDAQKSRGEGSALVDRPLLELAEVERARRIVIREKPQSKTIQKDRDGFEVRLIVEKDAPIRETVLEKDPAGRWIVANRFRLEADANWMGQTLRDLAQGRLARFVASDPKLMEDLSLNLGHVRLEDEQGNVIRRLDFGRKDGGEMYQFVRVNEREAFIAKHETEILGDPLTWVAGRVLTFEAADVRELALPFADAKEPPLLLRRADRGAPLLPSDPNAADAEALARNAEKLLTRMLAEPLAIAIDRRAKAIDAARSNIAATLRVTLFDGRVYTVNYGVVPKDAPGVTELAPYDDATVVFAFYECSDAQDLAVRQGAKAALGYNRAGILGRLPANRATLANPPAPPPEEGGLPVGQ